MKIQPYSKQKAFFVENNSPNSKYLFQLHKNASVYSTGLSFVMSDIYTFAPKLSEGNIIKNDVSFTVLFPQQTIAAKDTSLMFNKIRARAILALGEASVEIDNNFYGATPDTVEDGKYVGFPTIFKYYLNNNDIGSVNTSGDVYFTDVKISKILFSNAVSAEDITWYNVNFWTFLTKASLYQDGLTGKEQVIVQQWTDDFTKTLHKYQNL